MEWDIGQELGEGLFVWVLGVRNLQGGGGVEGRGEGKEVLGGV